MHSSRIVLNLVVLAAAVFLSGCYVATKNLPAGNGQIADERLIGAWQALDEDGKPSNDATFLHFLKPADGKPLLMVLVDDHSSTTYEMHTIAIGNKQMFAIKPLNSTSGDDKPETNYILGYYDVKGADVFFNLLDPKKLKTIVAAGKLKGIAEEKDYGKVTLTGSPQELTAFFASTDPATLIGGEKPAHARRVSQPK
jgi:hypothetical protein